MTRNFYRTFLVLIAVSTMLGGGMVHQAQAALKSNSPPTCTCSASMSFSQPELRLVNGVLTLIPRVDLSFTSRGPSNAPGWSSHIAYSGKSSYTSKQISVPTGVNFSGEQDIVSGMCGSKYKMTGYKLDNSIPLTGITTSMVGTKQQLDGQIDMQAQLTGCELESLHKAFTFQLKPLGNLWVHSWSTVR